MAHLTTQTVLTLDTHRLTLNVGGVTWIIEEGAEGALTIECEREFALQWYQGKFRAELTPLRAVGGGEVPIIE